MYLNTERFDDAIAFYQNEFLKRNPKDSKAMNSLAMLYFKKGDFDNGVLWLKKRLEVEGNNPEVYYLIGVQAWDRSYNFPDLDPALRAKIVDDGLQSPEQGGGAEARLLRSGLVHQPALPREGQDGDRIPPRSRSTRTRRTSTSSRPWRCARRRRKRRRPRRPPTATSEPAK